MHIKTPDYIVLMMAAGMIIGGAFLLRRSRKGKKYIRTVPVAAPGHRVGSVELQSLRSLIDSKDDHLEHIALRLHRDLRPQFVALKLHIMARLQAVAHNQDLQENFRREKDLIDKILLSIQDMEQHMIPSFTVKHGLRDGLKSYIDQIYDANIIFLSDSETLNLSRFTTVYAYSAVTGLIDFIGKLPHQFVLVELSATLRQLHFSFHIHYQEEWVGPDIEKACHEAFCSGNIPPCLILLNAATDICSSAESVVVSLTIPLEP